jgi:leader peptidase (prepilin peptidase)/N-methyltransferase
MLPFWFLWYASKFKTGETGKWMGFGDVVLGLCLGAMLGWPLIGVAMFLAIILGGIVSVFLLLFTKKTAKSQIAFGTFLSLGAILALFYGERLLSWYLSILGF